MAGWLVSGSGVCVDLDGAGQACMNIHDMAIARGMELGYELGWGAFIGVSTFLLIVTRQSVS